MSCILCGGSGTVVQRGARHAPDAVVRKCEECGLVFLTPRPSHEELDRYYASQYRREYADPSLAETLPEARLRLERLRALLGLRPSLLEVGSGSGAFLQVAAPHVKHLVGVEPSGGTKLEDIEGRFDVIVLFHVLEHVADPLEFLRRLAGLLEDGGRVVIEVPNVDDALVRVYDIPAYRRFYFQKAHLWYFSPSTLSSVLVRAGLISVITGVQRYDLSNHVRWLETGEPGGQGYHAFLAGAPADAYAAALVGAGFSDTLWAVARRNDDAGAG